MRPRVLHVIQRLSRGGAGRALTVATRTVTGFEHRVLSLEPARDRDEMHGELAAADIVHVHFWNTPELYDLLASELPPARVLLWAHVGGGEAPHVLTPQLVAYADATVACSAYTLDLPALRDVRTAIRVIPPAAGWDRVAGIRHVPHAGFNVGYIGTVDFAKMHPRYVAMSADVDVPGVRFVVCGAGAGFPALARQAERLGVGGRFELRGWVDDIRPVIARLDVFGYPLCADNYSASDLVLQEVMYAGVPPVVLPYGGTQRSVAHGRTGLVAADEDEYARSIEALHDSEDLRMRLGKAAREHALRAWEPETIAPRWREAYAELLAEPKRPRRVAPVSHVERAPANGRSAARFAGTLGDRAPQFERSLTASDGEELLEAERMIAASSPALASADAGGVLHYRLQHPDDAYLRLWAGLVLLGQGRPALAAAELKRASDLGLRRAALHMASEVPA